MSRLVYIIVGACIELFNIALIWGLCGMFLWNLILPDLLGVSSISFLQACGIGALIKVFKTDSIVTVKAPVALQEDDEN